MDQHKRTVHIFVGTPPFGGAMKIVRWPLWSAVPDLRCKVRGRTWPDGAGYWRYADWTGRRKRGRWRKCEVKAVRDVKFQYII